MIRNLKTLGLALVAVFAMSAVVASAASAKHLGQHASLFTTNAAAGEQAGVDIEQIGTNQFQLTGLPPLTCTSVKLHGKAITPGPSSTYITVTPTFETCHIVLAGLTKGVTVTHNECNFTFNATTTTTENTPSGLTFDRTASVTIECPVGKQIQIHVYSTANPPHSQVICTYDVGPQGPLQGIELTNKVNTPTAVNDVEAHIKVTTAVQNTIKSAVCGQNENTSAVYEGTATIRATNAAGSAFIDASVSD
jgi:hypothetical protein